VCKNIRRGWGAFSRFVRFEVGDRSKIKFRHYLCCGDHPLKATYKSGASREGGMRGAF
jgi:hypothetical protein